MNEDDDNKFDNLAPRDRARYLYEVLPRIFCVIMLCVISCYCILKLLLTR